MNLSWVSDWKMKKINKVRSPLNNLTQHPEHQAFLHSVLENPSDDSIRLKFSDWLEENGETERGEFIRVQCELAADGHCALAGRKKFDGSPADCGGNCHWCQLRRRERELLETEGPPIWGMRTRSEGSVRVTQAYRWMGLGGIAADWCEFRRGFVYSISLRTSDFLEHAEKLFRNQPIEQVTLTDKRPGEFPDAPAIWERDMSDVLTEVRYLTDELVQNAIIPGVIFDDMRGNGGSFYFVVGKIGDKSYDSVDDAYSALSSGLVNYGRSLAGLLPSQKRTDGEGEIW